MFVSEKLTTHTGPTVTLLSAPNDPLGSIAACAKMYLGEVVRDLADITDAERHHYLGEMQNTKLKMPLEAVQFHFMIEGVTRGFTHQMVRQRTAAYAQESMRFAVVEDSFADRVVLPPSLAGTKSLLEWEHEAVAEVGGATFVDDWARDEEINEQRDSLVEMYGSPAEKWRYEWDKALLAVERAYKKNVSTGMPAEDARGLLPTNIATRLNYITNFRGLLDHAGNRLCTQAQFEWRLVFAKMAEALRTYGQTQTYRAGPYLPKWREEGRAPDMRSSAWQFDALADLFRPVCYQVGSCVMKADFDRKCSIRSRVDAFAADNVPSSEWDKAWFHPEAGKRESYREGEVIAIDPIQPREWLADPGAAR